ncbi:MAG TPA: WYL domain-containing protein [Afifellaceae bacterium]|nr:WYL domain-containing protein [Afifellaceae bacterium]
MGIFDTLFGSRSDVPVIAPDDFVMGGPETDPPEDTLDHPNIDDIEGLALAIEYEHVNGDISSRLITCKSINPNPPGFLRAHCHLRNDFRTFRVDQIRSIKEMGTGEIIEKSDVPDFLAPYIEFAAEQDKAKAQRLFQRKAGPGIKVLVFLAASDGHVHPAERQVIVDYAQAESKRLFPYQAFDEVATLRWINHLKPTRNAARRAVMVLMEDLDHFKQFAGTMMALVRADGKVVEMEEEAMREIITEVRRWRGI